MTTREKILQLLAGYSIDTQDVLSAVAAHEARRLIAAGQAAPTDGSISPEARADLRQLLGAEPSTHKCVHVADLVDLYLGDREELASTQRHPTE